MESNDASRASADTRSPGSSPATPYSTGPTQAPPIRPLNRVDSRSSFPPQSLRPIAPTQAQPRPQFQAGGAVTSPQNFAIRSGAPTLRGAIQSAPSGPQQPRPPPLRPFGLQSITPQQGPRPQSPTVRAPPPNSLQFGPRQPAGSGTPTPDGSKPQTPQQLNETSKNGALFGSGSLPRQSSQSSLKGFDISNTYNSKAANLDNQSEFKNENQNDVNAENVNDTPEIAKGRSYSIAAAPGAPSPLKIDEDRRKSVSAIGGKIDEIVSRSPGLGLIQEGKTDSKLDVKDSSESIRSEMTNEGIKDAPERPESRLPGSKMNASFIEPIPSLTPKKKADDDSDVITQNNMPGLKNTNGIPKSHNKDDFSDRSPSLTRSDDSPEPKPNVTAAVANKSQGNAPEPRRPKTPKIELKYDNDTTKPTLTNKTVCKSPVTEVKSPTPTPHKPTELNTSVQSMELKKTTPRKVASAPKSRPKDGDNDSGVDETTQGHDLNGSPGSPNKKIPSKLPTKEKSSNSLKANLSRSSSKSATAKTPENPPPADKKKVPMNKVQVGNAPSPNIKAVKSKIGSLDNAAYKPGGGKIKIENRKIEFGNVTPKIAAKNDAYSPSGGSKKIMTTKLEWNAKSKVGSLQNAAYKPGGGDKKIETVKLDFSEKAKPKVGSTANITHKPGGGGVKIENQKLEFKTQSKVGSLDNVKHKPGGGDVKIFEDKEYIKQMTGQSPLPTSRSQSRQESPMPPGSQLPISDENLNQHPSDNTP